MVGGRLEPGSVFAGHRVEEIAGRGGMGVVYRAVDLELDRVVALKLISPDLAGDASFRERFRREARVAARIRHPHAVTVFEAGEHEGSLYLTMEFVEGADLGDVITQEERLEPFRAARLVAQVCGALDEVHRAGLVHRDLKPANVLVGWRDGAEHAFLTDFGLSRTVGSQSGLTGTGLFVGTLHYAAPEQFGGESVDARTDIYALGCVLYHALVGEVPYPAQTPQAQLAAVLTAPPPSPRRLVAEVPPALDSVVTRACAKDKAQRYPSAGDLGRAAQAAATGVQVDQGERSVAQGAAAPTFQTTSPGSSRAATALDTPPGGPAPTEMDTPAAGPAPTQMDTPGPALAPTEMDTPAAAPPPTQMEAADRPAPPARRRDAVPSAPAAERAAAPAGATPKRRRRTLAVCAALAALVLGAGSLLRSGSGNAGGDPDERTITQAPAPPPPSGAAPDRGSDDPPPTDRGTIDDAKLERELEVEIERQAKVELDSVECPEGRGLARGDVFECTATPSSGGSHQVRVTQTNDSGEVTWELE